MKKNSCALIGRELKSPRKMHRGSQSVETRGRKSHDSNTSRTIGRSRNL